MLKLFNPYMSEEAKKLCMECLNTDQLAEGLVTKQFEDEFAQKFDLQNVLALNSGSSALELAYELADIKEGDEVIVPILTCTATNIPLVRRKAKIVFADIDYSLNVNIEDVRRKITRKTKAIVFVHFGGNKKGLKQLIQLCEEKNIKFIEDAAQAVGNGYFGKADYTAVSLQAIKTLTSGDGGFLITKDRNDYNKAKRLRWFGYDREEKQKLGDTDLTEAGYKYHMNNITASIGLGNLRSIDPVIAHRERLGEIYRGYGLFANIWLAGGFTNDYIGLKREMNNNGFEIGKHHYRNDKYTIFSKFKNECPIMDILENKYFFVPLHYGVTEEDANKIGKIINKYLCQR